MKKIAVIFTVAGTLTAAWAPIQSAHGATPVPSEKIAIYKDNKSLVTSYLHALFVERNLRKAEKFWGDEMIQHNPTVPNGHDVLRDIVGKLGPDFRYEQGLIMKDGNFVMVHGRYTGWAPKPMIAVDIFRVENGKVVEHWDVLEEEVPAEKSANGHAMFPAK